MSESVQKICQQLRQLSLADLEQVEDFIEDRACDLRDQGESSILPFSAIATNHYLEFGSTAKPKAISDFPKSEGHETKRVLVGRLHLAPVYDEEGRERFSWAACPSDFGK